MAISNLETIIDNIEQMIENVRPDTRGRVMLPKDTLRQLVGELKTSIPDEIKKYNEKTRELEQSKNRELEIARKNAERIMMEANDMKDRMLNESEQIKLAEQKSREIIDEATRRSNELLSNAEISARQLHERSLKEYDDSLVFMINFIQTLGTDVSNIMSTQLQSLSNKLNEIVNARNELQKSIALSNVQDNSFSRPAWG
ncbi:MAG: hypothetical protein J6P02_00470 [Lachnospiraceae bacterium]|nr:hypothetical protein [Lachnospiraceae bacterium]